MAQRVYILKTPLKLEFVIEDSVLCLFEFQDFFERVNRELNIPIDGYSGARIKHTINRRFAQMITQKLYIIEERFPVSKQSKYNKNTLITKNVAIRFFENLLTILDKAYKLECDLTLDGE